MASNRAGLPVIFYSSLETPPMNEEGQLYIGHTSDLQARLERHNSGESGWTSNRGPWRLVLQEEYSTRAEAMKRERSLKSGRLNQELRAKLKGQW
jgi:putative endonuclease